MGNRVLLGNRSSGGYGLYVSRPGNNVLDCASDKLMFNTNSGETGNDFFSAGHFQVVPTAGGTGGTAPTVSSQVSVSAGATASISYQNYAGSSIFLWGGRTLTTGGSGAAFTNVYTFSSIGATSSTLTNISGGTQVIRSIALKVMNTAALF